ncbi:MAG: UDP-N-acetylmuramyl-tripeptide synthetase [Patescibacteria group bacterium]|nr:UDP-N-acetylmuramyl-tripeptide synthetase [Patescibacteria group bacterium]
MDSSLAAIRRFIPRPVFRAANPAYHWMLALASACWYRFPSRHIKVIAVTGTKGKSSTVEILGAILEEAGYRVALTDTIRFKIGSRSEPNLYKMSMPGRGFMQRFLRRAVNAGCDYAVLEMTSQGAVAYRHLWIDFDAFVFTNLSPEHIESHGSYERYVEAKLSIARRLGASSKKGRALIVNADDKESGRFMSCAADRKMRYSLKDAEPYEIKDAGLSFSLGGATAVSPLSGTINLYNILAAAAAARSQGVSDGVIRKAVAAFGDIPGRVQKIDAGQDFEVVVDYAHTPDSLKKFYEVFAGKRTICVLGGTGGGRDSWKRAEMGRIADACCADIILTDEDPYDEDPEEIVAGVAAGISSKEPTVIMDRRAAIREAVRRARTGEAVLITGKGTDPYIMGPKGSKTPWSDARVAREEVEALLAAKGLRPSAGRE